MADFSLQDLWWLHPKGPDNPLPALQMGVNIVQHKAQQDIQQGELANQVARTSLMREEMMYKQKIQTTLTEGNAAIAKTVSEIDDWADPASMSKVWGTVAQYPLTSGSKAVAGAQMLHRDAVAAKFKQETLDSRAYIAELESQRKSLLADSTVTLNDARIADLNSKIGLAQRGMTVKEGSLEVAQKKQALNELLADHTIPLTDARIQKLQSEVDFAEREMAAKEGNLKLRGQEIDRKEKRFNRDAWSREDHAEYNARSKAIQSDVEMTTAEKDQALQETRADIEANRQAREKFKEAKTAREGLKTNTPPVVPPTVIAPTSSSGITREQYEKLKPGEEYTDPNGVRRIKGQ